jgi:hypothetical protein
LIKIDNYLTSEFNEVYFSERRNFEATPKIPTSKNKFGWRSLQDFGTVKFLFYSPEYLEGLIFSATMLEEQKIKVISGAYSIKRTQ